MKTAVLFINVGTPDDPTPPKVGKYLKQFLMDPQVVDIPAIFRWIFVHLLIVPKRAETSAHAYQQVWTDQGSPLLMHTKNLTARVGQILGSAFDVRFAMRYGNPSIESVFAEWSGAKLDRIIIVPLYPQFALSSTQTGIDECYKQIRRFKINSQIDVIRDFYDHPEFIESYVDFLKRKFDHSRYDHVVFSFHGLPKRHLTKLYPTHCVASDACCEKVTTSNRECYRAQSYSTARELAAGLGIAKDRYSITFQSRLGRTEWIKPYTDVALADFVSKGIKKVAVLCPSFVCDCLETLEEIGIRAKGDFEAQGGSLEFIPCMNDDQKWAAGLSRMIEKA